MERSTAEEEAKGTLSQTCITQNWSKGNWKSKNWTFCKKYIPAQCDLHECAQKDVWFYNTGNVVARTVTFATKS